MADAVIYWQKIGNLRGPSGWRGEDGELGPEGPAGERGADGKQGEKGERGEVGAAGVAGEPGPVGEPGPPGPAGEPGSAGPQGPAGDRGESGQPGAVGQPGPPGQTGDPGEVGAQGEPGPQGDAGAAGDKGDPGRPGEIGPQGERGLEGPPGKLPIVKTYEPDQVHYAGDVVVHQGSTWQATKDTGQAPPHRDWIGLAFRGVDGVNGLTPQVRGLWKAEGEYHYLDICCVNGSSFIARSDNPGVCPGDGWQLLVSEGKRGKAGESITGPRGERGLPGERGARGEPAPHLMSWHLDRKSYRAIGKMSDGSETVLELRPLFEQFQRETQ